MATITHLKRLIDELSPAGFQEFCDSLLYKMDYGTLTGYGMKPGTGKTTKGDPDSYFRTEDGKYVLVACASGKTSLKEKLMEDIRKCLDPSKTDLQISEIDKIVCCHTSSKLSAGDDKELHDFCKKSGVPLQILGVDEIANKVLNDYPSLIKTFFGYEIYTGQILLPQDFIENYDSNKMLAPLNTKFQHRQHEKEEMIEALNNNEVVILTGKPGVGKTRLALEVSNEFRKKKGFKLLCVKNKNLPIYNDLITATEKPCDYLFLIDDANELPDIERILELVNTNKGNKYKIIMTVRDYAKEALIDKVNQYLLPFVLTVDKLSDEEIKELLNTNFGISNYLYIDAISWIAEGNARMAYMAGKVASEMGGLNAIMDASQLYDAYYKCIVNETIGKNRKLCLTAGILSFTSAIDINDLSNYKSVLDLAGITEEQFKDYLIDLTTLEVAELYFNHIVKISDQCFANYMVYYCFIKMKFIALSEFMVQAFDIDQAKVVNNLSMLVNVFNSEDTENYIEQEVNKAWDAMQQSNSKSFEEFAMCFHVLNPLGSFLIAQKKISTLDDEKYEVSEIDFSNKDVDDPKKILPFLKNYDSENLKSAMPLLLQFSNKSKRNAESSCIWLIRNYGIDIYDTYGYPKQILISKFLLNKIKDGDKGATILGYKWATESLGFEFSSFGSNRNNQFVFRKIKIQKTDELINFRKQCWNILELLSVKNEWKYKILEFVKTYAREASEEFGKEIVAEEISYLENFLKSLQSDEFIYFMAVENVIGVCDTFEVKVDRSDFENIGNEKWKLYKQLKKLGASKINRFRKTHVDSRTVLLKVQSVITDNVGEFVKTTNEILLEDLSDSDKDLINSGLQMIVEEYDEEQLNEFIKQFMLYGDNMSIYPENILRQLNYKENVQSLYNQIISSNFPQKTDWLYYYFKTIPDTEINEGTLNEFYQFLNDDLSMGSFNGRFRSIEILDKFLIVEPNIYPKACSIIFEKKEAKIVANCFNSLFYIDSYTPNKLLKLFAINLNLLRQIYFFAIENSFGCDYYGDFLSAFIQQDDSWLQNYCELITKDYGKVLNDNERTEALWIVENFIDIFDAIFNVIIEKQRYPGIRRIILKKLFENSQADPTVESHQRDWVKHIVEKNASTDDIIEIFELICDFDNGIKKDAVAVFLNHNKDFEMFDKLSFRRSTWSGTNTFIDAYKEELEFLESIEPFVSGVEFLQHKVKIKSLIKQVEDNILKEKEDAVIKDIDY